MGNVMDQMYLGDSPANFGQLSFYDAARGECYRDFGDCIGISARTLLQGLFGIVPDALHGQLVIRPGFPASWDSASVTTPYLSYRMKREGNELVYQIEQHLAQPLKVVLRQNQEEGRYQEVAGTAAEIQTIRVPAPATSRSCNASDGPSSICHASRNEAALLPDQVKKWIPVKMDGVFNASVTDIFKNEYLSPRPAVTTLQIPVQGIGEWCHPTLTATINDSVFRSKISQGNAGRHTLPLARERKEYRFHLPLRQLS